LIVIIGFILVNSQEVSFINSSPDGDYQSAFISSYYSDQLQEFGESCVSVGGYCDFQSGDRGRPWTIVANLSIANSTYTSPVRGEVWDDNKQCVFVTDWIQTGPGNTTDLGSIDTSNTTSCISYSNLSLLFINDNLQNLQNIQNNNHDNNNHGNHLLFRFGNLPVIFSDVKEKEERLSTLKQL